MSLTPLASESWTMRGTVITVASLRMAKQARDLLRVHQFTQLTSSILTLSTQRSAESQEAMFAGSGKSYSMVGYGTNKGIVPISCEEIFRRIANDDSGNSYEAKAIQNLCSHDSPCGIL